MTVPNFSDLGAIAAPPTPPPTTPPAGGLNFSDLGAIAAPAAAAPQATPAPTTPAMQPATMTPVSAWQALKNHVKANVDKSLNEDGGGYIGDFGRGFAKGGLGTIGGLVSIGKKVVDQIGSVHDLDAYKAEHPGATDAEAHSAVYPTDPAQKAYVSPETAKASGDLANTAQWFKDHSDSKGFWQSIGSGSEAVAELFGGDGLMKIAGAGAELADTGKAVSIAQKMKEAAGVGDFLAKHEKIAKLVAVGMKSVHAAAEAGAQTAGQTFVKSGGDATQAAEAGALGGALGGGTTALIDGVPMATRAMLEKLGRPSATVDAVEDAAKKAVAARAEATNATRTLQPNRLPASTGEYEFHIGGTPVENRVEGEIAPSPRKKQIGTQYVQGPGSGTTPNVEPYNSGAFMYGDEDPLPYVDDREQGPFTGKTHKEPVYQYLAEPKPGSAPAATDVVGGGGPIVTKDVELAKAHLGSIDRQLASPEFSAMSPEARAALESQRNDMQDQISGYYKHQKVNGAYAPNFQPIDTPGIVSRTSTFEDAADHLHNAATEVYEHANNVSGGNWQTLKDHLKDLHEKFSEIPADVPSLAKDRAALRAQIDESQSAMDRILDDPRNGIDQTDATTAKQNYRAEFVLRDAHAAIKPLYDIEQHIPLVSGQYKGFNGNMLGSRWKAFLDANPDAKNIIGADRVQTLGQLFQKNESMAARKRFGTAVLSIAGGLAGLHFGGLREGAEGAVAGGAAYRGIRYVLDNVVTSPRIAKSLLFAMDSGARPENYGPSIAKMIADQAKRTIPAAAAGATVRAANGDQ